MDVVAEPRLELLEDDRRQARIDLAAAHRLAVANNFHEGIDNHFTLNVPGRPGRFYLNAFGLHWSEVTASNLIEVDYEGHVVAGRGIADRSAVCIHAPIHRLRNVECVLHTHMPFCTALAQLEDMTLEMIGQNALAFYGKVAYDPDYAGFADELGEGERMADIIGDKAVLMLGNHGVVVVGRSVAHAFHRLYYLERACQTQIYAMSTGKPRRVVPQAIIERTHAQAKKPEPTLEMTNYDYHYAAWKRLLDRSEPDYAD